MSKTIKKLLAASAVCLLSACATPPPTQTENLCQIFQQYPRWYWDAQDSEKKWGVPVAVQMAIIHQESHFVAKAKPARTKLFYVIPWFRPSTAYGYTQALDITWQRYQKETACFGASRQKFQDAADFIGWYGHHIKKRLGIASSDAYRFYLAYHEGAGGYERRTYLKKPWLIRVAHKVSRQAQLYQHQLNGCASQLKRRHWWNIY